MPIYLTTGNISNKDLLELFAQNIEQIVKEIENNRLIEITDTKIVVKR